MNSYFFEASWLIFRQTNQQLPLFFSRFLLSIPLLLLQPIAYAQETLIDGGTLPNVTITEAEARNILKGLFDVTRLSHTLAIGKIARDERLTTFTDGFVQRNHIDVLTIGYIDSNNFWPRVFREQRLAKIEKAPTDNLLAAKIIFMPDETDDGTINGYNVTLELTGKSQEVYELLQVSREEIDSIASQTSQQQLNVPFATPDQARETVVNALIAALEEVEGRRELVAGEVGEDSLPEDDETKGNEALVGLKQNPEIVAVHAIAEGLATQGRLLLIYTITDTLNLNHNKLEIFKVENGNSTDVVAFFGLDKGAHLSFKDGRDDMDGWNGTDGEGMQVGAGTYLLKLTATTDEEFKNGFESFVTVEVGQALPTDADDVVYDYFVTDGDAWYRQPEAPYSTITPVPRTNILAKGTQVGVLEMVKDNKDNDVAKLKLLSTGETAYTSFSNLTQVLSFPTGRKYKFIVDYAALKRPFSEDIASKVYEKDSEITADKYIGNYVKVTGENEEHWILKSSVIWADALDTEDILEVTGDATKVATKFTGDEVSVACNVCVRSALLILKEEAGLFPEEGSAFYDPANEFSVSYPRGYITDPGRAKNIKEDFDVITTKVDLNARFTEIAKEGDESWEAYFKRLQDKADLGGIVIGAYVSGSGESGHVMMITPGGLVEIDVDSPKWGESFARKSRNILSVPRVLECGTGARSNEAPLCRNIDYNGAINRLKWYEYKF